MKKYIFSLLIILFSFLLLAEDINQKIFNDAIGYFENKDFLAALELFKSLENENLINADLYYNIGNCYFRLSDIGTSILYYKKALKIQSNHEAARRNLNYALTFTKDKQNTESENVIRSIWQRTFDSLSINLLAILMLIFWIALVGMIVIMIIRYRGREKTIPIFITTFIVFFLVVFSILSLMKWQGYHHNKEAVLIFPTAIGYSGPSSEYTRVFTIHEGMIFEIERQENDWSLIKLSNGLGGWIKSDAFEKI
ncbi:MAG: hypothetical protein DRH79_07715 [Candidatus Cloacimonadota bacterium]|nr:MAG: hypothetical protein DRH79_07715 [Candidatus Cloacimonadota bacterium]